MCADVAFDYATAYPIICYSLARSAGGLSTFSILVPLSTSARLCTCLFMLRSKQSRAYCSVCCYVITTCATFAEPDVRVRIRGRVVRVDVQRRQVRVRSVVTTEETAHQRQCSRLFSTSPSPATPIRVRHLEDSMDFDLCESVASLRRGAALTGRAFSSSRCRAPLFTIP